MKSRTIIYLSTGVGVAIGTALGVTTDNLGFWIILGITMGSVLGVAISSAAKNSDEENKDDN